MILALVIAVGVQTWSTDVAALQRYWTAADALGFARITYGDGLWGWTHDGWTTLGALAWLTRRARIGPAVTYAFDASSHHPSWLAKRAVTVDHLSGGRLDLRLGVGAEDVSASAFWSSHGIAYPDAGERVARLEETVDIVRALWRGEAVDHAGRFYTLRAARLQPPPVQRPGPPIWIAAMGSRALAVAATRADGWEASYLTPAALDDAWTRLGALVERAGRSRGEMRRSVELDVVVGRSARDVGEARRRFCEGRRLDPRHPLLEAALVGTPAEVVDEIGRYAAAGATDLMLGFADFPGTDMLQVFAEEVMPHLGALARPVAPEP